MGNRFYLFALGITALFVGVLILVWVVSGGKAASDAEIQSANSTRTSIAMTGEYLLQPRTTTPHPSLVIPTSSSPTNVAEPTSTALLLPSVTDTGPAPLVNTPTSPSLPSVTNTALFPVLNTPTAATPASPIPLPTQTIATQSPVFTPTLVSDHSNTKAPPLFPSLGTQASSQDPASFVRWYFTRVWTERDYQNLWDNYLTASYKANVGSGLFEDYVGWWNSVARVDVNSVDVLNNNGITAAARVNVTFRMQDGRVVQNQIYTYDFRYDPSRQTWMFDAGG